MASRTLIPLLAGLTLLVAGGCAMLDSNEPGSSTRGSNAEVMQQPVFLQPVFALEGLEQLPDGLRLDQLHVGVGAIFLDLLDSEDGVAFANRIPFKLHFDIREGQLVVSAPPMTLPHGGRYQVSVQIEPLARLSETTSQGNPSSLEGASDEASLVVNGRLSESGIEGPDGTAEPAPLPWHPTDPDALGGLRRVTDVISFSYSSQRSVRFMLEDIDLQGGQSQELHMVLQVGAWVQDTIEPALHHALNAQAGGEVSAGRVGELEILDRTDGNDAGMDQLIGAMDVEVR